MNRVQREYAIKRVHDILNSKLEELKRNLCVPGVRLSETERALALRKGKFKIKPNLHGVTCYTEPGSIFEFTDEKPAKMHPSYAAKEKKLREQAKAIQDQIMLGDAVAALKLINKFESQ